MPALFQSKPGAYVKVESPNAQSSGSALISVGDLLDNEVLLVTQFTFSQSTRMQYKPTLGGNIYVYPLGDNMGDIAISGLAAFRDCVDSSDVGVGFQTLADFYSTKKASKVANIKDPIKIVLPGLSNFTTHCFLESLSISGVDPENMVFGYNLTFKSAPATS